MIRGHVKSTGSGNSRLRKHFLTLQRPSWIYSYLAGSNHLCKSRWCEQQPHSMQQACTSQGTAKRGLGGRCGLGGEGVLTPQPGQQCRQSMGWAKGWGLFLLQRVSKTFSSFPSWITSAELEEKAVHDSFLPQLFACVGLSALRAVCVVPQHRSADQQNCCTPVNTQGRTYKQASGIQAFSNLIWRIHFVITSPPCPFKIKHLLKKGRSLEAGGYV